MWHGLEAAARYPPLRVDSPSTKVGVSCVECGTLPLDTDLKLKNDTNLNSSFTGKALSSVIVSAKSSSLVNRFLG